MATLLFASNVTVFFDSTTVTVMVPTYHSGADPPVYCSCKKQMSPEIPKLEVLKVVALLAAILEATVSRVSTVPATSL
ncbi:hypothetical protein Mapa_011387 [Marchantia paleacea]|nr:hypothetical protein Mapa_011387 [Marchantia paleacea]